MRRAPAESRTTAAGQSHGARVPVLTGPAPRALLAITLATAGGVSQSARCLRFASAGSSVSAPHFRLAEKAVHLSTRLFQTLSDPVDTMEPLQKLLSECKLEAVAHRNDDMLQTVSEATTVAEAMTVRPNLLTPATGIPHQPCIDSICDIACCAGLGVGPGVPSAALHSAGTLTLLTVHPVSPRATAAANAPAHKSQPSCWSWGRAFRCGLRGAG